jgi:hypothetical protein
MVDSALLDRVHKLEQENCRIRINLAIVTLLLVGIATYGFTSAPIAKDLQVHRLQVVGADGTVQIELASDASQGGRLTMKNIHGGTAATLSALKRGAEFVLGETGNSDDDANNVCMHATSFGTYLTVLDNTGASVTLTAERRKARIEATQPDGHSKSWPK